MKKIRLLPLFVFLCSSLLVLILASCDMFSEEKNELFDFTENAPDSAVLAVSIGGVKTETRSGVYQVDYNKDNADLLSESYVVELKHMKGEEECNYNWTFSSDDIKIYNISGRSFSIPCALMTHLGTYTVKAQSEAGREYDKVFIINCKTELNEIIATYSVEPEYINPALDYEEGMLEGTITRFTKKITLISGAVYNFTVLDPSGKNTGINDLNISKTSEIVLLREFYDNSFQLVCKVTDGVETELNISVAGSNANLGFNVALKDISVSRLYLLNEEEKREEHISLTKNTSADPEKSYTYKIETISSLKNRTLEFSLDFEDWGREAEEEAAISPFFKAERRVNRDIHWLCNSSAYRTFEDKTLFKVDVDGIAGTFTITPRNNTVFTHSKLLSENNLHCYLYVKYAEDDVSVYRQKWRIMIGGKLEGLEMVLVDPSNGVEKTLESDISVREGDETGWIFRAKYIPSTAENRRTLWYLASSKTTARYYSGDFYFDAPVPLSDTGSDKNRQRVLNMMQEGSYPYMELSAYQDENGQPFIAYKYFLDDAEDGCSDLWATYNSLALDVVLVALNIDEKRFSTVGIKDISDKLITVKSLNANAKSMVYGSYTGYENGDIQEYPNTIASGYETVRTFYMDYRETLKIRLDSSFKMMSLDVWGDSSAREIFPSIVADLDESGLFGVVRLQTLYSLLSATEEKEQAKSGCLTEDGVLLYVKIDNKYVLKLRIVVHEDGSNE